MRIVLTGATSMLGVALIEECIQNGTEVLAIVRKGSLNLSRLPHSNLIEILECDLDKLESIENVQKKYDVLYHFAWDYTARDNRDNPVLQEQNIAYTLDAVRLASRLGCTKFVGSGSQAEYGKVDGIITSKTSINPIIAYGMAKYAAGRLSERLCQQLGMIHIWARVFSVYGRNDNAGTMLVYAIKQFMAGEVAQFSAATQMWDYLHEKDAGKMLYFIGQKTAEQRVYCVASGKARPLKEFILEMQEQYGEGAVCEFSEENLPVIGLQADISDLIQDIGFEPQIDFKEGIADMIRFMRRNK